MPRAVGWSKFFTEELPAAWEAQEDPEFPLPRDFSEEVGVTPRGRRGGHLSTSSLSYPTEPPRGRRRGRRRRSNPAPSPAEPGGTGSHGATEPRARGHRDFCAPRPARSPTANRGRAGK